MTEESEKLREQANLQAIEDRLVGHHLRGLAFLDQLPVTADVAHKGPKDLRLIWFISPARCVDCLRDLSGWHKLARFDFLQRLVVLVGSSEATANRIMRKSELGASGVFADPSGQQSERLAGSNLPPYLLLLVDSENEILLAEARTARTACEFDPHDQIAALMRLRAGHRVRSTVLTPNQPVSPAP